MRLLGSIIIKGLMEDSECRHQRVDGQVNVTVKGLTEKIVIIRGMMEKTFHRQRVDGKKPH